MKTLLLRGLLWLDAVVLVGLGVGFVFAPGRMLNLFGFADASARIAFILGVFGTVYATLGVGYALAARHPLRNQLWVQIAIGRAVAECLFGVVAVSQGMVGWRQAGFGIVVPAFFAVGYALLYPRPDPLPESA